MKRSVAMAVLVLSVTGVGGLSAAADDAKPSPDGRRVRISAPGFAPEPIIGTLIAIDDTTVSVQRPDESENVAIPRNAVTLFEISRAGSRKGRGAGLGALSGLGVGAALGFAAGEACAAPDAPSIVCFSRGASAAGFGLVGAVVGTIVGAIAGPGEKWETANPDGLTVSVTPVHGRRGGVGLMLSLRF